MSSRPRVRIERGKPVFIRKTPTEPETTMALAVFFSAAVPGYLMLFGPRELSGFMLSFTLATLFMGWLYLAALNEHYRRKWKE